MNGRVLVDTTVIVEFFRTKAHVQRLAQCSVVNVTPITLGELYYGAYRSGRLAKKEAEINDLLHSVSVLEFKPETYRHYGQIKAQLAGKGVLIPENDIWIAAFAMENHLPLATRDAHFGRVEGLTVEKW